MESANRDEKGLDQSMLATVASEQLKEIVVENAEVALDSFLEEGVYKNLPIFGTLYKTYKAAVGVREAIFAKKVYQFLTELKDIPHGKRLGFVDKLANEKGFENRVGEKVLMILDQLDDMNKPAIIGRLFKASILEQIDYETFMRLSSIVSKSFLPDIAKLGAGKDAWDIREARIRMSRIQDEHLASLGIMSMKLKENKRDAHLMSMASIGGNRKVELPPIIEYELNKLGEQLIQYGLRKSPSS